MLLKKPQGFANHLAGGGVAPTMDFLVDEGVIDPEDRELLWYANSAEEAWQSILRWYEMKGDSLLKTGAEIA